MTEEEEGKQVALRMLREAVDRREFTELPTLGMQLHECQICGSAVDQSSFGLHLDWHDKVHAGLVELGELLLEASR